MHIQISTYVILIIHKIFKGTILEIKINKKITFTKISIKVYLLNYKQYKFALKEARQNKPNTKIETSRSVFSYFYPMQI